MSLLELSDLTVRYPRTQASAQPAVDQLNLCIREGERVGLTGPSGCGKTTVGLAMLSLLPEGTEVRGSIRFAGRELKGLPERELSAIRGAAVSIVFQEPALALNPVMSIGAQIAEVARAHSNRGRAAAREHALNALREVGFGERSGRVYDAYPHQLSGGERQRALIAQATVCRPRLIVADEPTASLDASTRRQILNVLHGVTERHGTALLLISHSAETLASGADRILHMSAGQLVPAPVPPRVRTWLGHGAQPLDTHGRHPWLEVRQLTKTYHQRRWLSGHRHTIRALDRANLHLFRGATLGLAGASGSGKSTLARCLAAIETPDEGEIRIEGRPVAPLRGRALRSYRNQVQLVFQDAAAALNPRFTAADIIAEPLVIQGIGTRSERRTRALELMSHVELPAERADARPGEFSGGQRQRLGLARALAVHPRLLILDEALSGVDDATRSRLVDLLRRLQVDHGLTYLCISHDMELLAQCASEIAVMDGGRIVEPAPATALAGRASWIDAARAAAPLAGPVLARS